MSSETQILNQLANGQLSFPPLQLQLLERELKAGDSNCDALIQASWEGVDIKFAAEVRRYSSDRVIHEAARQSRYAADRLAAMPLIITPWLSPEQLNRLEKEQISGIDLSGNGLIVVPGKLLIMRTGKPNLYPDSRLVKNVYEGSSSLVPRAFLLKPSYGSVNDLLDEIRSRSGSITQSTVSKALKQLEEDLVVWREKGLIKLLQADKLLDKLVANFKEPRLVDQVKGKLDVALSDVPRIITSLAENNAGNLVLTGTSSVSEYATMSQETVFSFYCNRDLQDILSTTNVKIDFNSKFPNFRLIRTEDPTVFFDTRTADGIRWSSPVQCYLELMKGDKREKETAEQLRKSILKKIDLPESANEF